MSFKIGFSVHPSQNSCSDTVPALEQKSSLPRKSLVQVHFPDRNMTLSYFNDRFDLHPGNIVYVDGKLEGMPGYVKDVSYNFKIKLSDYKRIIAVADTDVSGTFFMAGSHFVTFDRHALPFEQVLTWFKAPEQTDDSIISSSDDDSFCLDHLSEIPVSAEIAERGFTYYQQNKVLYLCIDGTHGYAVVEGSHIYTVEFTYDDHMISGLVCSCFCFGTCKHEFAAMLQLRETLELITQQYSDRFADSEYFAAICKSTLFHFAIDGKTNGSFTL